MLLGKCMSERIQRVRAWHPVNVRKSCSPMPWAPASVLAPRKARGVAIMLPVQSGVGRRARRRAMGREDAPHEAGHGPRRVSSD
jgi:hypothetical protein